MRRGIARLMNRLGYQPLDRVTLSLECNTLNLKDNIVTTLNTGKIVSSKPAHLKFDVSSAIAQGMTKANPAMGEYALALIKDSLLAKNSDTLESFVTPVMRESRKGDQYMDKRAMLKAAYGLAPSKLITIIESARESYDAWIVAQEIEHETTSQTRDRHVDKMTDSESRDPMIAQADIPHLVNGVMRTLSLMPKSGIGASLAAKLETFSDNELIAAYRAFEHMPLIDDSRRMSAYRAELKTRNLSLGDVIEMWDQIDNPPKQTRSVARKTTDSPSEKRTPAKATPAKATPRKVETTDSQDDRDAKKAAVLKLLAELL